MTLAPRHGFFGTMLVLVLLGLATACSAPSLCSEPWSDNQRLLSAINQLLRPLKIDPADPAPTIQEIARLLLQQPCVRGAEFDDTIVATEPALFYGRLTLQAEAQTLTKKLTLRYSGHKIWLEKIE